ncbi:guanosine-3',5'-bis(diphosphate) 3'-pyrophosphohydrolase MESH1-like [Halichondria panicea]|uniref:guanosine-3',5'-bis(diphosphate) 3'-pyrophosphohydrolase MESH1-like n=1 Tax=Halichondria panicea TaxID=6063 RepID=UPI00312B7EDC
MDEMSLMGRLLEAVNFAALKHRDQRRKDEFKTPYINHPIGVAYSLWKEGGVTDMAVLQAAVLHDTVEDTATTFDELELTFGPEVRQIVQECSDDKTLHKMERKRQQIINAPHKSIKARLVSYADKLYNLRDLCISTPEGWTQERVQEYFVWSAKVVGGMLGANNELERRLEQVLNSRGVSLYGLSETVG